MTIEELKYLKESEDRVEFKAATRNFNFAGGDHRNHQERRKCVLGYMVALANERGGRLVLGMSNDHPHKVVGSSFGAGQIGAMEDVIYERLKTRVRIRELFEGDKRIVVFEVPSRPIGIRLKFEGIALMRTGESLRDMSDEEERSILNEQEPDFSARLCKGLSEDDLDLEAVTLMKAAYAKKQKNPRFLEQSLYQVLTDLDLKTDEGITYAALILLGKTEAIRRHLPQSRIIREFRATDAQTHHDAREVFEGPLYKVLGVAWNAINDPRLNRKTPVQMEGYMFDLFSLNEEVVREALLNAVAHRDYTIQSEVVVKQYPERIVFCNPGGFPKGVTLENILTVSSTPRSRLMTEVMEKTALVERSGQGVDKIFSITLSEGKAEPDYKESDAFQVTLSLSCTISDKPLHVFINRYQRSGKAPKLSVAQIITLCKVRHGHMDSLNQPVVDQLLAIGLLVRSHHSAKRVQLHDEFYRMVSDGQRIGARYTTYELEPVLLILQGGERRISEIEPPVAHLLSRGQLRGMLHRLMEDGIVVSSGRLKGTRYAFSPAFSDLRGSTLVDAVLNQLRNAHG